MSVRSLARLLAAVLVLAACHRTPPPAQPDSGLRAVRLQNGTDQTLIVSWQDGADTGILGTLRPGESRRFVLSTPAASEITVHARSNDGTVTSGPHRLRLASTGTPRLVLR